MKAKKVLSLLTAAALVVGATPLRSFAQDDVTYQDGVYTGTATVQPDEDEDFDAYDIQVNVTIQDGKITDIAYANADTFDSDNVSYANRALNGRGSKPGLISKMTEANSAEVDTVGGATCSSNGVITAVKAALEQAVVNEEPTTEVPETEEPATEAPETEEPTTEVQETEAPVPETEEPTTETPETEESTTEAEIPVAQSGYVLMNIPYADFYAADVQNSVPVDSVSSATQVKTRGTLSKGSYHVNTDGSEITGVIFPVKVANLSDLAAYKQVTDADSFSITTTNRGTTSTVDYVGKDALFENNTYAYYVLDSAPSFYKELTITDGALSFGPVIGDVITTDATADITTKSSYGDYQIGVDGLDVSASDDTVYAVILKTVEGDSYGLRHLENIWRVTELAWCTGFTTAVHNCPTSSDHYVSMMGQTINEIVYYTSKGIYSITTDLYVPVKLGDIVSVADSNAGTGAAAVSFSKALPEDFTPVYTVNGLAVSYADGALSYTDAVPGAYTLTITDASGKYATLSTSFQLITDSVPAAYNAQNAAPALVPADGVSAEDFAAYVSAITSVTVNDTAYAASGKRVTKVILDEGTIDTSVDAFTEGTNTVTVTAAGYPELTFVIDTTVEETEPSTEETEPSSEVTEPSTEETEPSTEATEPSTEETEPSTEATEPSAEETEPSTEETEPSTEETEPSTEETEPSTEETKASLDEGEAGATGDISSAYLWSMLLLLGGASCAAYTVTRKKKED